MGERLTIANLGGVISLRVKGGHKLIGYLAITEAGDVFFNEGFYIISGSKVLMNHYLAKNGLPEETSKYRIKKITFSEIIEGINNDYPYVFDQKSMGRFTSLLDVNNIILTSGKLLFKE